MNFRGAGCLRHSHIQDGATLTRTVPSSPAYWRGLPLKEIKSGKGPVFVMHLACRSKYLAIVATVCGGLSFKKKFWTSLMFLFCSLRFRISWFWPRTHLSFWNGLIVIMEPLSTADERQLQCEMPVLRKSWKLTITVWWVVVTHLRE